MSVPSGGPLFTKNYDGEWVQLGLVSWGPVLGEESENSFDVNTNIYYFKDWIEENMRLLVSAEHIAIESMLDAMLLASIIIICLTFASIITSCLLKA